MWGMTFEKSLRMFDPAYKRLNGEWPGAGGIDRKCPKCGVPLAGMAWDPVLKEIRMTCVGGCGFAWWAKPLDSQTDAEAERVLKAGSENDGEVNG